MKATIESTSKIVLINGIPCRLWEATTERGTTVHFFVTRVAVPEEASEAEHAEFALELQECKAPSAASNAIPLRMIL